MQYSMSIEYFFENENFDVKLFSKVILMNKLISSINL